ncbi:MAG: MFS transporter, partial [Victivallales bacterium]|nr:MFS transporter [Victivallales bacterium]
AVVLPGALLPLSLSYGGVESDSIRMLILSTIGGVLNMTVCPAIGVISDWHRSRFGRRIPFIFMSMPPIVLAMVMMAFIPECSSWLTNLFAPFTRMAPGTATALAAGLAMLLFQFFFMWIGSVIWYLLGDVVPSEHYGRVTAAFQMGMTLTSVAFNRWVFPLAKEHMTTIFLIGALTYAVGITIFCYFVKERTQPGERKEQKKAPALQRLRNFFSECFCHRIYLYKYLVTIFGGIAACSLTLNIYFYQEIFGQSPDVNPLDFIGKMTSWSGLFTTIGITVISLVAAGVINRWHPIRTGTYALLFSGCSIPAAFRWLFGTLSPEWMFYMTLSCSLAIMPISGINSVNGIPMELATFPKSRFGTFCSMQALVRSVAATICGLLCGGILDLTKPLFADMGVTAHYRLVPVWNVPWQMLQFAAVILFFLQWRKLGGDVSYNTPASWEPDGFEVQEKFQCSITSASSRFTLLLTGHLLFPAFTLAVAVCSLCMNGGTPAAWNFILPTAVMLTATALWWRAASRIRRGARICDWLAVILILCYAGTEGIRLASVFNTSGSFLLASLLLPALAMLLVPCILNIIIHLENRA